MYNMKKYSTIDYTKKWNSQVCHQTASMLQIKMHSRVWPTTFETV